VVFDFGTFLYYFEDSPDDIINEDVEIKETEESDVETMVYDLLDEEEQEERAEETIEQGYSSINEIDEEYGFSDSAVIYTNYLISGTEINDYLYVVKNQEDWLVFDSLAY